MKAFLSEVFVGGGDGVDIGKCTNRYVDKHKCARADGFVPSDDQTCDQKWSSQTESTRNRIAVGNPVDSLAVRYDPDPR